MTERPQTETEIVDFVRSIDVEAPESLHDSVGELVAERRGRLAGALAGNAGRQTRRRRVGARRARAGARRRRASVRLGAASALAAAAIAVLLVMLSSAGGGSGPTLSQATALTLSAATMPAPAESRSHRAQLVAAVDGVAFPSWEERFGWRSTGARTDRVAGRSVTTVFYADAAGRRIGYAIVAGIPAPRVSGGTVAWREGTPYRLGAEDGGTTVTWLRQGRLCVVAGRGVAATTLLALASWDEHAA